MQGKCIAASGTAALLLFAASIDAKPINSLEGCAYTTFLSPTASYAQTVCWPAVPASTTPHREMPSRSHSQAGEGDSWPDLHIGAGADNLDWDFDFAASGSGRPK
jgi:hypothetical protein